jgi:hypothetical protein
MTQVQWAQAGGAGGGKAGKASGGSPVTITKFGPGGQVVSREVTTADVVRQRIASGQYKDRAYR